MGKTSIEWTDESINPIVAELSGARGHYCEKVSSGCKNCYSSNFQPRFGMPQFQEQRNADVKFRLLPERLEQVLRRRKPTRFFWCDMTDMFGAWVPNEWIAACFGVMAATPRHTHQVLTKRAERLPDWFAWLSQSPVSNGGNANAARGARWYAWNHIDELRVHDPAQPWVWPLPNVHLGVSCEDQQRADERIQHLLAVPAAVRWVSAEPLLGPVRLDDIGDGRGGCLKPLVGLHWVPTARGMELRGGRGPAISWVVVGGESGQRARPCDVAWIRSIVEQCKAAAVPVFVKQVGARPIGGAFVSAPGERLTNVRPRSSKGGDPAEWPDDLRVREMPR